MSRRHAPLYVEAYDLAVWVLGRVEAWPVDRGRTLRRPLSDAVCGLVTAVSVALTFPDRRLGALRRADEIVVEVRMLLRLAEELALISPGGRRHALGRLREIGKMLGGWQKQLRRAAERSSEEESEPLLALDSRFEGTGSPARTA